MRSAFSTGQLQGTPGSAPAIGCATPSEPERGPSFDVYVARSFAHYLWTWLEDAGREYGVSIAQMA